MVFTGTRRVLSVRNRFNLFFLDSSCYQIPTSQALISAVRVGGFLGVVLILIVSARCAGSMVFCGGCSRCGAEGRCAVLGVLRPLSRFFYSILCGLVMLICGGNWGIPRCFFRLYRFNPLYSKYGLLR